VTTTLAPAIARRGIAGGRTRPADVLLAEWTKLRSVRSTWWTLLAMLIGTVGIGLGVCYATVARWDQLSIPERLQLDPTFKSLTGLLLAQVAVAVLGALAVTSEYSTGMIRSTFAAVPGRRSVLAAKTVVLVVPVLIVSTAACVGAFLGGQAILASKGAGVSLSDPAVLRAVIGGGLYLTVMTLFAFGLGAICRRTAGAVAGFVGLVLVAPTIVGALPRPWGPDIAKYLPSQAGQAILNVHPAVGSLAPWTGFAVLCAWAATTLAVAAWLITRRDA
jgi:ABC-type transport system involved in multi-copper enzyme maturation permease subunit